MPNPASPLISVIIPAYNAEGSLVCCVESVLEQVRSSFEIETIIVDDGSLDLTGEIADWLSSQQPEVHSVHQINRGLSCARNTGIDYAKGDYLFFLDADDQIEPQALGKLYTALVDNGADFAVGGVKYIDEKGLLLREVCSADAVVDERGYWDLVYGEGSDFAVEFVISCGKLFNRSLFDTERFDVGKIHEDEFIIHRLVAQSRLVAVVEDSGYLYVQKRGSISHSRDAKSCLNACEAFLYRAEYFASKGWDSLEACALAQACLSLSAVNKSERNGILYSELHTWCFALTRRSLIKVGVCNKSIWSCLLFFVNPYLYLVVQRRRHEL